MLRRIGGSFKYFNQHILLTCLLLCFNEFNLHSNQTKSGWDKSDFIFNRARIGFIGTIPYDVSYYFFTELSPFKTGYPYLLDAFITYSRLGFARISVGQFKSPVSLEQNTPCQSLHTINRSTLVEELAAPQRDLGLMISGGADTFFMSYSVGVFNGTGILTTFDGTGKLLKPYDNNMGKDIVGRVVFRPLSFLNLGGSFRYGTSPTQVSGADPDVRKRFGGELAFKWNNLFVQSEYLYGEDIGSYTTGGGCGEPLELHQGSIKRAGMFVMAGYMTPWRLQPVIKYENYNKDLSTAKTTDHITTYGINYFLNDWTRIQINYLYKAEEEKEVADDCLLVQFQVKF